ncbi:MAG: hypothetical protein ACFFDF_12340 [Candidatus Odinarchaeota archaeon]
MFVKKIIYLDSNINVCCVKNKKEEREQICPELVQHVFFCYSVGLVNNPASRIKEKVKIENKKILYGKTCIVFSFYLEGLLKPEECDLTVHSITFFFKGNSRKEVRIEKTEAFKHIESDPAILNALLKTTQNHSNQQQRSSNNSINTLTPRTSDNFPNIDEIKLFIDSYEKFKAQCKNSDLQQLLTTKPSSMEFNLKSFGISLLCKLLLLIKSVNELVDNDFQKDLHEFLKSQILHQTQTEVMV